MNREIPGFYYDPDKKKYFRIESNRTAPADAAWSASNVKRRKVEDKAAKRTQELQERTKSLVKRAKVLADPLLGGFLNRELGIVSDEVPGSCWALGLRAKGRVSFAYGIGRATSPNIQHMYINGSDTKTGLGVAYLSEPIANLGAIDGSTLYSHYIPTDVNDSIDFGGDAVYRYKNISNPFRELVEYTDISSISYYEPAHKMLITSRDSCGVFTFSPEWTNRDDEERPSWLLGQGDSYEKLLLQRFRRYRTNVCAPSPVSSDLMYLLGTNNGVIAMHTQLTLTVIVPPPAEDDSRSFDTLSIDFNPQQPKTFYAGGRYSRLWQIDLRAPPEQWDWWRPGSSATAHVKGLTEHTVLAAGISNSMRVFDVRFQRRERAQPVVEFHGYRNEAHTHIGLDVNRAAGVVAAAHDDGTVAVYSLRSGRRLRAGDVDGIAARAPVQSMVFQTMPREKEASLFAGVGSYVKKYSFGTREDEW